MTKQYQWFKQITKSKHLTSKSDDEQSIGCSCCCVPIAIAIVGSCSGCTWREGRHGDKDVENGRVNCASRLPLLLPLLDRVQVALGEKYDNVTKMLIMDVSRLLMMLKDCCRFTFRCCVVRVSRLPLSLPLSDCVPDAAATILVALGGKDALAMILTADVCCHCWCW